MIKLIKFKTLSTYIHRYLSIIVHLFYVKLKDIGINAQWIAEAIMCKGEGG